MAIDRMDFAGNQNLYKRRDRIRRSPRHFNPAISGFAGEFWEARGEWNISAAEAVSSVTGENEFVCF